MPRSRSNSGSHRTPAISWAYNSMSPSRKAAYRRGAQAAGCTVTEYLQRAASGMRFCRGCKEWKPLQQFFKMPSASTVSGFCRSCYGTKDGLPPRPEDCPPDSWGPYVRAAKVLGIPPLEYYNHKQSGENYCIGCKTWFEGHTTPQPGRDQYCTHCREEHNARKLQRKPTR